MPVGGSPDRPWRRAPLSRSLLGQVVPVQGQAGVSARACTRLPSRIQFSGVPLKAMVKAEACQPGSKVTGWPRSPGEGVNRLRLLTGIVTARPLLL